MNPDHFNAFILGMLIGLLIMAVIGGWVTGLRRQR